MFSESNLSEVGLFEPAFADSGDAWCDVSAAICNTDWKNRFEIVIDETLVGEVVDTSHTNFTVMINVTGSTFVNNIDDDSDTTIEDIRFFTDHATIPGH